MKPITLFTFGYKGWGNATPQLVQAVDAVERSRGFKPPIFVDIRIRRSVRAEGFKERNFEKLLGPKRHHWMRSLGNMAIITKEPRMRIADPAAAADLLDLAVEAAADQRRVIFFCSCEWPSGCHRSKVAELVLKEARARKHPVRIEEWPGGEPTEIELKVPPDVLDASERGTSNVPLGAAPKLATYCGIPWCSIVTLHSGIDSIRAGCDPAKFSRGEWVLPLWWVPDSETPLREFQRTAKKDRAKAGLNGRSSSRFRP